MLSSGAFGLSSALSSLGLSDAVAEGLLPSDRKVALIVGNWDYANASKLNSPSVDIRSIAKVLQAKKFETPRIIQNCTVKEADEAVSKFAQEARTARIALFYYSGHGIQLDGKNYGVPVNFDASQPADEMEMGLFALNWAETAIGRANSLGIMIIDACRENPYLTQLSKNNPYRNFRRGLAPNSDRNEYVLVSYAAGSNQLARDGLVGQNSLYTEKLLAYLKEDSLSVKQVFEQTQTAVCDATAPGALPTSMGNGSCQQPEVTHNIGSALVYLMPPADAIDLPDTRMIVSFGLANLDDEIVRSFTHPDVTSFKYNYLMLKPDGRHENTRIIPNLPYFSSEDWRGVPLIVVDQAGYYAPDEESGGWGLSYPVLDLVVRSISPKPLKLKSLRLKTRKSREDKNPYFDLLAPMASPFGLTVINQCWDILKDFELQFDIIGRVYMGKDEAKAYADSKMPSTFPLRVSASNIDSSAEISLANVMRERMPEIEHFAFLQNHDVGLSKTGKLLIRRIDKDSIPVGPKLKAPPGFEDWYRRTKAEIDSNDLRPLWIIGKATATASSGATITADVVAPLYVYNYGVGGGAIEFDINDFIKLPINGQDFSTERPINKTLNISKQTFRDLFPLVVEKSSFHEISVEVLDASDTPIYASGWIDLHALVSRNDKKAAVAERRSLQFKI
jgi:hypothetical protein